MRHIPKDLVRLGELMHINPFCLVEFRVLLASYIGDRTTTILLDPMKVEELMIRRGEFDERMSVRDNVVKVYGKEAAEIIGKIEIEG